VLDTLATCPYVIVRMACSMCSRRGHYRPARLAAKYGADIDMGDLLECLAGDCKWWRPRRSYQKGCGAYFIDLGPGKPPPDLPPGVVLFRPRKAGYK
jgi:hypothetical protein